MGMQQGQAAWKCSMDVDMQPGCGLAAWTWTFSMDVDIQHGDGHVVLHGPVASSWTCTMEMDMQHGLG
jgi:hypothetical protein